MCTELLLQLRVRAYTADSSIHTVCVVQDQYCFIFKAVLEGLILGETTVSYAAFMQRVSQLDELNEMTAKSRIETEFEVFHQLHLQLNFFHKLYSKERICKSVTRTVLFVIFKSFAHYENLINRLIGSIICYRTRLYRTLPYIPARNN